MNGRNPWCKIKNADYENHMGHKDVGQLAELSRITEAQLELVRDKSRPVAAILGIANGNGLERIDCRKYSGIIGIDISEELLAVCRERYFYMKPIVRLYPLDLTVQKRRAAELLYNADLVTANLLVEHIHLENFIDIVRELEKAVVSVTIQVNPDGSLVSCSGFEQAFSEIVKFARECGEGTLLRSMKEIGYGPDGRFEYPLPNGKFFVRLDFCRGPL